MKLTPEQIEETGEAVKAWMRGESIEFPYDPEVSKWQTIVPNTPPGHLMISENTRLRRKPKLRPWNGGNEYKGQLPVIRYTNTGVNSWHWQVLAVQHDGFVVADCKGVVTRTWTELADAFEHSTDGCLTFKPCGILES